ncbi:hypothetical protein AB0F52_09565 [Amycolatopsis sp. NPDC024027]|uniref:hypothetical protein n=1 Tax=Amycolatopsis sp. NPDC024027 TaxID=3154327 RepID=UPI00340294D8
MGGPAHERSAGWGETSFDEIHAVADAPVTPAASPSSSWNPDSASPHRRFAGHVVTTKTVYIGHSGLNRPLMIIGSRSSCVTGTCEPATAGDQARVLATARWANYLC